jgi:hypothetical protein
MAFGRTSKSGDFELHEINHADGQPGSPPDQDGYEKQSSTNNDQDHMRRLGRPQQFDVRSSISMALCGDHADSQQRTFRFLSIMAFSLIAEDGWVFMPKFVGP